MYDVTPRVEIDAQGGWSEYQAHRLAYTRNVPVEPVVSASDTWSTLFAYARM